MIPAGWSIFSGRRRESARSACGGSFRPVSGKTVAPAPAADAGFPYVSTAFSPCFFERAGLVARRGKGAGVASLTPCARCVAAVATFGRVNGFKIALSCGRRMGMAGCASSGARLYGEYQCRNSLKFLASLLLLALSPLAVKPLPSAPQPAPSSVRPLLWSPAKTSRTAASSAARSALSRARSLRAHRTATNIFQDIAGGVSLAH